MIRLKKVISSLGAYAGLAAIVAGSLYLQRGSVSAIDEREMARLKAQQPSPELVLAQQLSTFIVENASIIVSALSSSPVTEAAHEFSKIWVMAHHFNDAEDRHHQARMLSLSVLKHEELIIGALGDDDEGMQAFIAFIDIWLKANELSEALSSR